MFKKMMAMLLLCSVLNINAVKRENKEIVIQGQEEGFYYLELLPVAIQNYIATFALHDSSLEHESEEQFIARARQKEEVYARIKQNSRVTDEIDKECCVFTECNVYSPGENIVLAKQSSLNLEYTISYKQFAYTFSFFPQKNPICFAVSEKGQLAGIINKDNENSKYVLRVVNLIEREKIVAFADQYFELSVKKIKTLIFNRQGTAAVVFGTKSDPTKENYQIISLKTKENNSVENKAETKKSDDKQKNLLQHYFRKRYVCKSIKSGS